MSLGASCSFVLVLAPLAACRVPGPSADPAAARLACGLAEGERVAAERLGDGTLARPLSADCAAHLGEDLGLDWESFSWWPEEIRALDGPAPGLLAGAFLLVAADHGSVAEILDDPLADPDLAEALQGEAQRVGLSRDVDAGGLLYAWVTARVDHVRLDADMTRYAAVYEDRDRSVWVSGEEADHGRPAWMASVLVHEASHLEYPGHTDCLDRDSADCDGDLLGAYGVQAWGASAYLRGLSPDAGALGCADARATLLAACAMINDPSATPLCDGLEECG